MEQISVRLFMRKQPENTVWDKNKVHDMDDHDGSI